MKLHLLLRATLALMAVVGLSLPSASVSAAESPAVDSAIQVMIPADTMTTIKIDTADIRPYSWYRARYPYMGDWGKVFSFESEFLWPAGATRPDSSALTPFQFWVSHMPLWHNSRGVSSVRRGAVFPPNQISRAVRFPWRTSELTDYAIPFQMMAEYFILQGKKDLLQPVLKAGDTLNYRNFLSGSVVYGSRGNVYFEPDQPRADSMNEFDAYINLLAINSNYASLAANADTISYSELLPGDLIIARNETGFKGKVHIVLVRVDRPSGESYFIVGTGCDFACDFHIPLFNIGRRELPWLSTDQVRTLGDNFPIRGAYRLRLP